MSKNFLLVVLFFNGLCSQIQAQSLWTKIEAESSMQTKKNSSVPTTDNELLFELNIDLLKEKLAKTTGVTSKSAQTEITIPNTAGVLEKFTVWESSNFEAELQDKYPDIRAYQGKGITDTKASVNFSLSPKGFQTIVFRANMGTEFIEAYPENEELYMVFSSKHRDKGTLPMKCSTKDIALNKQLLSKTGKSASSDKVFRTLRLALSCTGEYGAKQGNSVEGALASMNATMTRVNGIFNRDLSIKLNIIATNELVIFTNADTDPYSSSDIGIGSGTTVGKWHDELKTTLNSLIGSSNYDIGHLFGGSGGGGDAGCIGCVCDADKGTGFTSPSDGKPEGDTFDIDFVAHEMGHQLGANHSFSHSIEGTGVSVEPGSGSTIMGYAGVTGEFDMQNNSDDYFNYASILQINSNLATKTCIQTTTVANNPPMINAGANYTIPKGTPFILKGTGSDIDNDKLTYTWEQNDSATNANNANSLAVPTKTNGPLFRSLYPSDSPVRYMPAYSSVLVNNLTSNWESVSSVERTLHFVLTARDNAAMGTAQTKSDDTEITVKGDVGPFEISTLNTEDETWKRGSEQIIKWNVNKSNTLLGASKVNIKLSIDGGVSFPITLASNVSNDGYENVVVPNITERNCRLLIEPTDNIFYAINSQPFSIGYAIEKTSETIAFSAPFAIPESLSYTSRTINFPENSGTITDVKLNANFTHTLLSDLQMDLKSPNGKTVKLYERNCDNDGTLNLVFNDAGVDLNCTNSALQTVKPFEALSSFYGVTPTGTWTFRVRDAFLADKGTLNTASLTITTKKYTLTDPDFRILNLKTYSKYNDGKFTINFEGDNSGPVLVTIYNLNGLKVFEREYPKTESFNEDIQIQNPKSGLYLLEVSVGNKRVNSKILVK